MGQTNIEWADFSFNPWEGCTKVSPGCLHCYAEMRNKRFGGGNWGKGKPRRRTSAANWKQPLKWNRFELCHNGHGPYSLDAKGDCPECGSILHRPRVFCASLADWLDDEVPIEWLTDLLKLIHDTPNLDWQLLSKRPENFFHRTRLAVAKARGRDRIGPDEEEAMWSPNNVWIGTSVEDQQRADERIPELLKIPARVRFLSVEPILEEIDFSPWLTIPKNHRVSPARDLPGMAPGISQMIFGGESGPGARPCNIEWIRDGVAQCRAAGVKAFVKQMGSNPIYDSKPDSDGYYRYRYMDKKGGDMVEWPEDLRVREFPV